MDLLVLAVEHLFRLESTVWILLDYTVLLFFGEARKLEDLF